MAVRTLLLTFVLSSVATWPSLEAHQKAAKPHEEARETKDKDKKNDKDTKDSAKKQDRADVLARAQVWRSTNIASMNLGLGPQGAGAFKPHETVTCDYVDKKLGGNTPKFDCKLPDGDEVKVKYGGTNGEVYGELLATRLLWALGFGADAMYSVNVVCRGCPAQLGGIARPNGEFRFDPAVVERKMSGKDWHDDGEGWAWEELDKVDPKRGGAPKDQRDAFRLLAVFIQHSDSKPQQQRIVCLGEKHQEGCARPFLMINDLGMTFGAANLTNANDVGSVNLKRWYAEPIWTDDARCVGNLKKSFSGTLHDPPISEAGRAFLSRLMIQLSDEQIRDLFEAARVDLRLREPGKVDSGFASVDEWVRVFKMKRDDIVHRTCV